MGLNLYSLNDDGDGDLYGDDITWAAIWAPNRSCAEEMFAVWYERFTGARPGEYSIGGDECDAADGKPDLSAYAPAEPGFEKRSEVLQLIGIERL